MKKALKKFPTISKALVYTIGLMLLFIFFTEVKQVPEGLSINILSLETDPMPLPDVSVDPYFLANWKTICYVFFASLLSIIFLYKLIIYSLFDRYYRVTKRTVSSGQKDKVSYRLQTAISLKKEDFEVDEIKMRWRNYNKYGRSFKHKESAKKYFDKLTREKKNVDTPITETKKRKRRFTFHRKMPSQFENGPAVIIPFIPRMFIGSKMISIPSVIVYALIIAGVIPFIVEDAYLSPEDTQTIWIYLGVSIVLTAIIVRTYLSTYDYYLRAVKREIKQGANSETIHLLQAARSDKKTRDLKNLEWTDVYLWRYIGYTFISPGYNRSGIKKRIIHVDEDILKIFNRETNVVQKVVEETVNVTPQKNKVTVGSLAKAAKSQQDIINLEQQAHQYSLEGEQELQEIYEKAYDKVFHSKMYCQFVPEFTLMAKNEAQIAEFGYQNFPYSKYEKMRKKIGGTKNDWLIIEGSDIETHGLKDSLSKKPAYWDSYLKFIEIKQQNMSFEEKMKLMNELEASDESFKEVTQTLSIGNVHIKPGIDLVIGGKKINTASHETPLGEQWFMELMRSYKFPEGLYVLGYDTPEKIVKVDVNEVGAQLKLSSSAITELKNKVQKMKKELAI